MTAGTDGVETGLDSKTECGATSVCGTVSDRVRLNTETDYEHCITECA